VSSPVISGMFIAEEAHGAGDKGSGDTTTAICTAFFFEKIPTICLFHCCSCFFLQLLSQSVGFSGFPDCWMSD